MSDLTYGHLDPTRERVVDRADEQDHAGEGHPPREGGYDPHEAPTEAPQAGSLEERMAKRRDSAQRRRSEWFGIPGWDDMLEVQLRLLSWKTMRGIGKRHATQRDESLAEVYTACDQIQAATEGFREVLPDGSHRERPDETWVTLARKGAKNLAESPTPRQAMLALVEEDARLMVGLYRPWQEWMEASRPEVEEELAEDFG